MTTEFEEKHLIFPQSMWPFNGGQIESVPGLSSIGTKELLNLKYPWELLVLLRNKLTSLVVESRISKLAEISSKSYIEGPVWVEDGAKILPFSVIIGPCIIGKNTLVGNHTQIRGSFIGDDSLVGAGVEIVRTVCGQKCTFHKNYVGDSLFGENIQVGGDSGCANMRVDGRNVTSFIEGESVDTGLSKLGAIIGSNTIIAGAGAVTMPGVKIGKNCLVGPGVLVFKDLSDNLKIRVIQGQEIT